MAQARIRGQKMDGTGHHRDRGRIRGTLQDFRRRRRGAARGGDQQIDHASPWWPHLGRELSQRRNQISCYLACRGGNSMTDERPTVFVIDDDFQEIGISVDGKANDHGLVEVDRNHRVQKISHLHLRGGHIHSS